MLRLLIVVLLLSWIETSQVVAAKTTDAGATPSILISSEYISFPNIVYTRAANYEAKLDLYRPADSKTPTPLVIVIHGGGWVNGTKEEVVPWLLPYMEMGFAVINVEYRLARISPAPAAVEDCLCVLHWVGRNAKQHNFDLDKVVVTGASAGGHLALTTAMIPTTAGFENQCANDDDPTGGAGPWPNRRAKVAAVINWFGITDVADLAKGENTRAYAVTWLGSRPDREEIAQNVSPINYVSKDIPPILTIHGDRDTYVPYAHARRLHDALTKAGVRNQLLTIAGRGHGDFTLQENVRIWTAIKAFLAGIGIKPFENRDRSH